MPNERQVTPSGAVWGRTRRAWLFCAPAAFACMDAGGRAASGTKAESVACVAELHRAPSALPARKTDSGRRRENRVNRPKEALNKSIRDLSRPSFMDRMSCMRRDAYRDVGGRPRREQAVDAYRDVGGRPRREQAVEGVERRREQAAEGAGPRLKQAARINPGGIYSGLP